MCLLWRSYERSPSYCFLYKVHVSAPETLLNPFIKLSLSHLKQLSLYDPP